MPSSASEESRQYKLSFRFRENSSPWQVKQSMHIKFWWVVWTKDKTYWACGRIEGLHEHTVDNSSVKSDLIASNSYDLLSSYYISGNFFICIFHLFVLRFLKKSFPFQILSFTKWGHRHWREFNVLTKGSLCVYSIIYLKLTKLKEKWKIHHCPGIFKHNSLNEG